MFELQRVEPGHAPAVLAFEVANRAWFASSISDRGDAFFDQFAEGWAVLLALQEAGTCLYHLLVTGDGEVVGRFNLVDIEDRTAVVGYRVAEHVAGRGVATTAVRQLCELAAEQYGLRTLRAAAADANVASQRVLIKAGFVRTGPAAPAEVGGEPGSWFRLDLPGDNASDRP
jgi:RimJ/RimL family protein N-acetyltransferase